MTTENRKNDYLQGKMGKEWKEENGPTVTGMRKE